MIPGAAPWGLPPPPDDPPGLRTVEAVGIAVAAAVGALVAAPMSTWLPVAAAVGAVAARRPRWLIVAVALASSMMAARAEAGMAPPDPRPWAGRVVLVTDPETRYDTVEAVGRADGRLLLLEADGAAAEVVAGRLAGEPVRIEGRVAPLDADDSHLRTRHVVARLRVRAADPGGQASAPWRIANRIRRTLVAGVEHLGDDRRALYSGLVLGDDRDQPPEMVDDFRGSGLSHLLAVSGQNVAFVTVLLAPLLRRLPWSARLVALAGVLTVFTLATRFEPSVLRAVAMASAAALAAARGRPTPAIHVGALAVTALVLVDPFLVRSVGFQLSVVATTGILLLGPRLADALPGPTVVTVPFSVGASAQLGVAPLLVAYFGGVPVVSLPANVVGGPAAALVMTWGLPAGLAAGLIGDPWARALHLPTRLALDGLWLVARTASSLPLGELDAVGVGVVVAGVAAAVAASTRRGGSGGTREATPGPVRSGLRIGAGIVVVTSLLAPAATLARPATHVVAAPGVEVWRAGGATVVTVAPSTGPTRVLEGLRRAGVTRVDVLVVGPGMSAGDEERAARHRARVARTVWRGRAEPGERSPVGGLVVDLADGTVRLAEPA